MPNDARTWLQGAGFIAVPCLFTTYVALRYPETTNAMVVVSLWLLDAWMVWNAVKAYFGIELLPEPDHWGDNDAE